MYRDIHGLENLLIILFKQFRIELNYSLESFAFGKGQHYIKNARQQSTNTLNTQIVFDQ